MNLRRITAFLMSCTVLVSSAGCGKKEKAEKDIRVYTSFFGARGNEISKDNDIQQLIAEKTGAMCEETWLDEREDLNTVFSDMMISNKYPDFLVPDGENCRKLIKSGAFIPLDNYWDKYPNIKNFYSESEWNRVRSDDVIYIQSRFFQAVISTIPLQTTMMRLSGFRYVCLNGRATPK